MIRLHEILKIVADLRERGELALAQQITAQYMDRLDSSELRFHNLALLAKLDRVEQAMDWLEASLNTNQWFSPWFLQRSAELKALSRLPRFQGILAACAEKEVQYWQSGVMTPIVQVPPSVQPPYPLLIALHGNGFNSQHSAEHWSVAAEMGWLVFHPLSKKLVGYGLHWWDAHEENRAIITEQARQYLQQYTVDPERMILAGFSKGGETAMVLALLGEFGAKGFITVGAGGYYHMEPDHWQPLLASPPRGLRGVAMYSPYDLERAEGRKETLEMLRAAGIEVRQETYCAEGHVFPGDFAARFQNAAEFITGSRPSE